MKPANVVAEEMFFQTIKSLETDVPDLLKKAELCYGCRTFQCNQMGNYLHKYIFYYNIVCINIYYNIVCINNNSSVRSSL